MEYKLCGLCNGDGRIEYADSFTNEIDSEVCPKCQGHGRINTIDYDKNHRENINLMRSMLKPIKTTGTMT